MRVSMVVGLSSGWGSALGFAGGSGGNAKHSPAIGFLLVVPFLGTKKPAMCGLSRILLVGMPAFVHLRAPLRLSVQVDGFPEECQESDLPGRPLVLA